MQSTEDVLRAPLVDAILERFELSARPDPTLEGLRALFAAWNRSVPFDNIRKIIAVRGNAPGPLPGDDPVDFFTAWLRDRAGGTCWATAGALHALLTTLGFRAERGIATMMVAPEIPPNHGTVTVQLGHDRYVVDPSILHHEPLLLRGDGARVEHGAPGACGSMDIG